MSGCKREEERRAWSWELWVLESGALQVLSIVLVFSIGKNLYFQKQKIKGLVLMHFKRLKKIDVNFYFCEEKHLYSTFNNVFHFECVWI